MTTSLTTCLTVPQVYVQLAQRQVVDRPTQPLVITSGATDRAVVIDGCAHAHQQGIRRGMAPYEAHVRCPEATIVPVQQLATEPLTAAVEQVLFGYSDVVTHSSVGTWLLDLVALGTRFRHAHRHLQAIAHAVTEHTGYPCQLGTAPNGMIATIAAERATTAPIVVLPGHEARFLAPLPVQRLPNVGPETTKTLAQLGIRHIGQLAHLSEGAALAALGPRGRTLRLRALGQAVCEERVRVAVVSEHTTFGGEPCTDPASLRAAVRLLTERVGRSLRFQQTAAGTITVTVTWVDGRQGHQQHPFVPRCDLDRDLSVASRHALDQLLAARRMAVTSIEVRVSDLGPIQRDLLTADDPTPRHLQQAVDAVKHKHGTNALVVASLLHHTRRAA
ncbi:MAG: hypothetical protein M3R24_36605 [Chloroflexota bacterium]|nr:hypothetical protein [Chloroflexota bacterium]